MGVKAEKAKELFREGYNCSQSVLGAFCEDVNLDFETAMKLAASFGGGMGRLREVCGAVSGMFMVAGLKYGYTSPTDKEEKTAHYRLIQQLAEKFKQKRESIVCRDLLRLKEKSDSFVPADRTKQYYAVRPCEAIVGEAAELVEEMLCEHAQAEEKS